MHKRISKNYILKQSSQFEKQKRKIKRHMTRLKEMRREREHFSIDQRHMSPYQRANSSFDGAESATSPPVEASVQEKKAGTSPFVVGGPASLGSKKKSQEIGAPKDSLDDSSLALKLEKFRNYQQKRQKLIQSKEDFKQVEKFYEDQISKKLMTKLTESKDILQSPNMDTLGYLMIRDHM